MTLYMLKGLPASGKTTYTKMMVKMGIKRVNRDDLRDMVDSGVYSAENEKMIRLIGRLAVKEYLSAGYSVVIDNTNLKPEDEAGWREIAEFWGADFIVIEMDTSLNECIARDRERENPVGEKAIRSMARLEPNPLLK